MPKLLGGTALLGLSLFMLMGFVKADLKDQPLVNALTFGVAVVLPMGTGLGLLHSRSKQKQRLALSKNNRRPKTLQTEILRLALAKAGRLTMVEVVSELAIAPEQANSVLNSLAQQGLAELQVTESGVLVYAFYDIQHLSEKNAAQGILDA